MGVSIKPFDPEGEDVGQRWSRWLDRFELYLQVKKVDDDDKMVHLLYYAGEYVHDRYVPLKKRGDKYDDTVNALNGIFNPPVNKQMNIFKFQNMKQYEGELLEDFVSRLRGCVSTCGFSSGEIENQLKSQIIQGCISDKLRRGALKEKALL